MVTEVLVLRQLFLYNLFFLLLYVQPLRLTPGSMSRPSVTHVSLCSVWHLPAQGCC